MEKAVLFIFLAAAAVSDLKYRRVSNRMIILFLVPGLFLSFVDRGASGAADGILTAVLVFTLLYSFYAAGYLGAGDIKFIMTAAVYTGHVVLYRSLIPAGVFSLMTLLVMIIGKRGIRGVRDLRIPMAVPVSMGIAVAVLRNRG